MIDDRDDLSDNPTIASLTKLIGAEKLSQLSEDMGGRCLFIPLKPGPDSPLAFSIGLDAAIKISQVYGGMDFEVPVTLGRRARILRLRQQGKGPSFIARELKMSRRGVQNALAAEDAKNQLSFFSSDK